MRWIPGSPDIFTFHPLRLLVCHSLVHPRALRQAEARGRSHRTLSRWPLGWPSTEIHTVAPAGPWATSAARLPPPRPFMEPWSREQSRGALGGRSASCYSLTSRTLVFTPALWQAVCKQHLGTLQHILDLILLPAMIVWEESVLSLQLVSGTDPEVIEIQGKGFLGLVDWEASGCDPLTLLHVAG